MKFKLLMLTLVGSSFCLISCLKTRSEVGEDEQSQVYNRKNSANQKAEQNSHQASQLNSKTPATEPAPVDERDEVIRSLNGRVENLENQITQANKEKSTVNAQDSQKIQLLQEALTKMEAQLQKLELEQAQKQAAAEAAAKAAKADEIVASSDSAAHTTAASKKNSKGIKVSTSTKSTNTYELAQGFFAGHEWKKAILNYQKYVDDNPKGSEVADSKYKIGVCFQELGMKEESMAFYEEVIANYAKTDAGKKAKIRLAKLKK